MFLSAAPVFVAVGWLPTLIETAGASVATAALTASLFSVGGAVGGVAAGSLADRFGIKVMLPFAMAGVVAVISLGLTIGSIAIVPVAGVAGFFAIGLLTLMSAVVGQFYPEEIRALSVGASLAVMRIGAAAAPWAAGHLLDLGLSPGGLFAGCAAIGMASGLAFSGAARQRGAAVEKGAHSGIAH
nr:MFS transporter [Sphingobium subterraneum]